MNFHRRRRPPSPPSGAARVLLLSLLLVAAPPASALLRPAVAVGARIGSAALAASVEKREAEDVATATPPPDLSAYSSAYLTVFAEQPCSVVVPSSGSLPPDLRGTYFRVGPAMFSAGSLPPPATSLVKPKAGPVPDGEDAGRMVAHPFEGDGAALAVTMDGGGRATSRFRYVRTNAFTNERKRGGKMYSGMEGTRMAGASQANDVPLPAFRHHLQPGLNRKRKNTSNTRAVYHARKLLTLWEGGLPYKLDALALSTEGRSQLGGVLKEADPLGAGVAYDAGKGRLVMYSNGQDAKSSTLSVYEFNSKFRPVSEGGGRVEVELPGFALLSDIAVTERYYAVIQPGVEVNGMQFLLSKEPGKCLEMKRDGAILHLIPRAGSADEETKSLPIPPDALSDADAQLINAYESSDGRTVVIDAVRSDPSCLSGEALPWPWASTQSEYARTSSRKSLWRYEVDLPSSTVTRRPLSDVQAQFGVANPARGGREHRFVYAAVSAGTTGTDARPPQGIGKFDVREGGTSSPPEIWMPEPHEFCGEPAFAPRARAGGGGGAEGDGESPARAEGEEEKEDDGYLLSVLYDGRSRESSLVVLDARSVSSGPVARVPLGGLAVPHGLHGCFASAEEAAWDEEEIRRRAKLADKMEGRGSMWNEVKSDFSGLGLRLDDIEEYFGDVL